jgi:hypothetical protein
MRIFCSFLLFCVVCHAQAQRELTKIFASLANADKRIADYRLSKQKGEYKAQHKSLSLPVDSRYDAAKQTLLIEETNVDNGTTHIFIFALRNAENQDIYGVIRTMSNEMEFDNSIEIWQRVSKKQWKNISIKTLPKPDPKEVARLEDCGISVRQVLKELPFMYVFDADRQQLVYTLDRTAVEKLCKAKKTESVGGNTIPICDVLQCVRISAAEYQFDIAAQRFEPITEGQKK